MVYLFKSSLSRNFSFVSIFTSLIIFLSVSIDLQGQDKGKLRVFTKPSNALIKLENQQLEFGKFIELDTGNYVVKAWAEKSKLIEREVRIDSGYKKTLRIDLPYSDAYKKYRFKLLSYRTTKNFLRFAPIISYGILAYMTQQDIQQYDEDAARFKQDALSYKDSYESAFFEPNFTFNRTGFETAKANYEDAINNLNQAREFLLISSIAAAGITYISWKLSNKLKKPSYSETPLLTAFSLSPVINQNCNGFSLSCKIK